MDDIQYFRVQRELAIRNAQDNFWSFCQILHDYKNSYEHLILLCDTLQKFFENKLLDENNKPYRKLMINMPPRFFKTRTMILFCSWILGKNKDLTIISTSYSDDLATEFSRFTRDEIQREKNLSYDIVYSDIFPDTKIKQGDASASKWSLEGRHFTYLGAGFGASITGKGAKIAIIDDQIKNYEEANNEMLLDKKWEWYVGTFKSRFEEGVKEIIVMTRWTNKDICGRILEDEIESKQWFVLKMEAKMEDKMLCPEMLSEESYNEKKRLMPDDVFQANYHQVTIEKKGLLYQQFKEYIDLPLTFSGRYCFVDPADQGDDSFVGICGIQRIRDFYITDILHTKEAQEVTQKLLGDMIIRNNIYQIWIESNFGRAFSILLDKYLREKKYFKYQIFPFHQESNKMSRILTNAANVENQIYYPQLWNIRFPEFHREIKSFMRSKKNKHDDAADCLTMIVEHINKVYGINPNLKASDLGL